MGMRLLVAVFAVIGIVRAQDTKQPAPLDLQAIAKQLAGDTPAPVVVIPDDVRKHAMELDAQLAEEDRELLLAGPREFPGESAIGDAQLAAAVATFARQPRWRASTRGLIRELHACEFLARAGSRKKDFDTAFSRSAFNWWPTVVPSAVARARWLGALFLREFPDDPEVVEVLSGLAGCIELPRVDLEAEIMRRRGEQASGESLVIYCVALLRAGNLDMAQSVLQRMQKAPPLPFLEWKEAAFDALVDLQRDLREAKRWQAARDEPGLAGKVATLRFLQVTNAGKALTMSRELVSAHVEHALPFAILAADAFVHGRQEECAQQIERALALPGNDTLSAATMILVKLVPLAGMQNGTDKSNQARKEFEQCVQQADAVLAQDDSESARLFRGFRQLGFSFFPGSNGPFDDLGALEHFAGACPDSGDVHNLLLAGILSAADAGAARAALAKPLSDALAASPRLALQRAQVGVALAIANDDAATSVDGLLRALEQVQADCRDAEYLRGLLSWSRSTRDGADMRLRVEAHEHFAKAMRRPFERGARRVVLGMQATQGKGGGAGSLMDGVRPFAASDASSSCNTPVLCLLMRDLQVAAPFDLLAKARERDGGPAIDVLDATLAEIYAQQGDAVQAKQCAKEVLAREPKSPADAMARRLAERGIFLDRELRWSFPIEVARAGFATTIACNLYPIPPMPTRERLQQLAHD